MLFVNRCRPGSEDARRCVTVVFTADAYSGAQYRVATLIASEQTAISTRKALNALPRGLSEWLSRSISHAQLLCFYHTQGSVARIIGDWGNFINQLRWIVKCKHLVAYHAAFCPIYRLAIQEITNGTKSPQKIIHNPFVLLSVLCRLFLGLSIFENPGTTVEFLAVSVEVLRPNVPPETQV